MTQEVITTTTAGELLGDDGRYTILFLGSDKRCRKLGSPLGAERCSSLESKVSAASVEGAAARDLYPYIWSNVADVALDQARNRAGTERTDTMTLLTVDPGTGEAAALSIPRDMERFPLKPFRHIVFALVEEYGQRCNVSYAQGNNFTIPIMSHLRDPLDYLQCSRYPWIAT